MPSPRIERALISVSDKTGLAELRESSQPGGWRSSAPAALGGTWRPRAVPVHDVSEYTGFPEMMDGRVKTLHPKVFAGIFAGAIVLRTWPPWPSTASSASISSW